MSIKNYFTKENFESIFKDVNIENKKYMESLEKNFYPSIFQFLTEKSNNNELQILKYSDGHYTNFIHSWNKLVHKEDLSEYEKNHLIKPFESFFAKNFFSLSEDSSADEIFQKFVIFTDKIDEGSFRTFDFEKESCCECGQDIFFPFKNWLGISVVREKIDSTYSFVPPKPCMPTQNYNLSVNFPTGQLLAADWFKIEEFTKHVVYKESDQYENTKSLNYTIGKLFHAQEYANKHNFISICVGNSSPSIFQNKDTLVIGEEKLDPVTDLPIEKNSKLESVGSVCTDLWNATIIDKETLKEILMNYMTEDIAQNTIDSYIKKNDVSIINVNPGQYNITFNPQQKYYKDEINESNQDFINSHDVWFFAEPTKMNKTIKLKK